MTLPSSFPISGITRAYGLANFRHERALLRDGFTVFRCTHLDCPNLRHEEELLCERHKWLSERKRRAKRTRGER